MRSPASGVGCTATVDVESSPESSSAPFSAQVAHSPFGWPGGMAAPQSGHWDGFWVSIDMGYASDWLRVRALRRYLPNDRGAIEGGRHEAASHRAEVEPHDCIAVLGQRSSQEGSGERGPETQRSILRSSGQPLTVE